MLCNLETLFIVTQQGRRKLFEIGCAKEMLQTQSNLVRFSKFFFLLKAYENRQNLGAQLRTLRAKLRRPCKVIKNRVILSTASSGRCSKRVEQ